VSSRAPLPPVGQGLNRVQAAPRVSKAMHNILWRCQQRLGGWVGSAVVHLVRCRLAVTAKHVPPATAHPFSILSCNCPECSPSATATHASVFANCASTAEDDWMGFTRFLIDLLGFWCRGITMCRTA